MFVTPPSAALLFFSIGLVGLSGGATAFEDSPMCMYRNSNSSCSVSTLASAQAFCLDSSRMDATTVVNCRANFEDRCRNTASQPP